MIKLFEQWLFEKGPNAEQLSAVPKAGAQPQPVASQPAMRTAVSSAPEPAATTDPITKITATVDQIKNEKIAVEEKKKKLEAGLKDQFANAYIKLQEKMTFFTTMQIQKVTPLGNDEIKLEIAFSNLEEMRKLQNEEEAEKKRPGFIKFIDQVGTAIDKAIKPEGGLLDRIDRFFNKPSYITLNRKTDNVESGFKYYNNNKDTGLLLYNGILEKMIRDVYFTESQYGTGEPVPNVGALSKAPSQTPSTTA